MDVKGFTLIEILAVLIIIGILSAIALPNFTKAKESALGKEAIANLKLIAAAERIYRMESADSNYVGCVCYSSGTGLRGCDNTSYGCNYLLKLNLSSQNWIYRVENVWTGPGPFTPTFTAVADRQGERGYLDCRYKLPHNDSDGEPNVDRGPCP